MLYNAKNGQVNIGSSVMDYIKFGKGEKNIIMIPGLGDGLKTVKGMALPMAVMYRQFAKDFTVWVFSRKQPLEPDANTRTMATGSNGCLRLNTHTV
ncbi:MAG: alpha/beta hydrolase, partial [Ruminococcaceae bacterium]|nr:alpha/beta hydrolase [Oscillospiraceae bacterium]